MISNFFNILNVGTSILLHYYTITAIGAVTIPVSSSERLWWSRTCTALGRWHWYGVKKNHSAVCRVGYMQAVIIHPVASHFVSVSNIDTDRTWTKSVRKKLNNVKKLLPNDYLSVGFSASELDLTLSSVKKKISRLRQDFSRISN